MTDALIPNLVAGVIILILDMIITYLIFNRLIIKREMKRWKPFREHLLNTFLRSVSDHKWYFDHFMKGLDKKLDEMPVNKMIAIEDLEELLIYIRFGLEWFEKKRNEVFTSIQTAIPSISGELSQNFTTIFRFLDNNMLLTSELGNFLYKHMQKENEIIGANEIQDILTKFRQEIPHYQIKMIGGYGNYYQVVEDIIKQNAFRIDENQVVSMEEFLRRKKLREEFKK